MIIPIYYRIKVLKWARQLAEFSALWLLITYLTGVLNLDITHAAAIVNLFAGAATMLPIGTVFLVDAFVGDYCCLLVSSLAFTFGLIILTVSTLSPSYGDTQKSLMLYLALTLNAIGVSGHTVSLDFFLDTQDQVHAPSNQDDIESKRPCSNSIHLRPALWCYRKFKSFLTIDIIAVILIYIAAVALSYASLPFQFGIPAAGMVVAILLFVSGSSSYKTTSHHEHESPIKTVCRVLVASLYKRSCHSPKDATQLHEDRLRYHYTVDHTQDLRFLDKATIINLEQQEENGWEFCRASEVEEVKLLIRMIPLWMTFIMIGIVTSIGDTYFLEQADNMDAMIGNILVPGLYILQAFYHVSKYIFTILSSKAANKLFQKISGRCVGIVGAISTIVFSILCCIIAAKVETRKLSVIKSAGLVDKPKEIIPMSMFWILPQYFFLAIVDGTSEYLSDDLDKVYGFSIACFNVLGQVPSSTMVRILRIFTKAVFGAGIVGSVILAYVVSSVSKMGGGPSWFQETLNRSRLDNYYWTVAVLSSINLVFCILVAIWYTGRHLMLITWAVVDVVKRVLVLYFNAPVVRTLGDEVGN